MSPDALMIDQLSRKRQSRYEATNEAHSKLRAARTALRDANEVKQASYDVRSAANRDLDEAWTSYMEIKEFGTERLDEIESYKSETEEYINQCRETRNYALHRGDDELYAQAHADTQEYQSLLRTYAELRRETMAEIAAASALFREKKAYFEEMKDIARRSEEDAALRYSEYIAAEDALINAQEAYDDAAGELAATIDQVREVSTERRQFRNDLAIRAEVPVAYRDALHVTEGVDGSTHLYYGGIGRPGGEGHAHVVFNTQGVITYHRRPHSAHGSHNYTAEGFLPKGRR